MGQNHPLPAMPPTASLEQLKNLGTVHRSQQRGRSMGEPDLLSHPGTAEHGRGWECGVLFSETSKLGLLLGLPHGSELVL